MSPLTLKEVSFERRLRQAFFIICITLFIGYVIFQSRNFIQGPSIALAHNIPSTHTERAIELNGLARNVVILTLNGREIHIDEQGAFGETLMLEKGYTIVKLEAEDRYGRTTELTRSFIYEPGA